MSCMYSQRSGRSASPFMSSAIARSGRAGPRGAGSARKIEPKRYATLNRGSSDVVRSSSGNSAAYRRRFGSVMVWRASTMRLVPPKYCKARIQYKSAATAPYASAIRRADVGEVTYSESSSTGRTGNDRSRMRCSSIAATISSPIVTTATAIRPSPVIVRLLEITARENHHRRDQQRGNVGGPVRDGQRHVRCGYVLTVDDLCFHVE